MLRCFFSHRDVGPDRCHGLHIPDFSLLSGPPRSGKTSLLFQFAYNIAQSECSTVVFICKRHNAERKPPILSEGVNASSDVFERVHMKYVNDDTDVRKYFAAFHLSGAFPKAVIIDDFFELFDEWKCRSLYGQSRGREIGMIKTLAVAKDAIDYANKNHGTNCKLLISDTHTSQVPRLLYVYQRWMSAIITIEALDSTFLLKIYRSPVNIEAGTTPAQYTLAEQYLKLVTFGCPT